MLNEPAPLTRRRAVNEPGCPLRTGSLIVTTSPHSANASTAAVSMGLVGAGPRSDANALFTPTPTSACPDAVPVASVTDALIGPTYSNAMRSSNVEFSSVCTRYSNTFVCPHAGSAVTAPTLAAAAVMTRDEGRNLRMTDLPGCGGGRARAPPGTTHEPSTTSAINTPESPIGR